KPVPANAAAPTPVELAAQQAWIQADLKAQSDLVLAMSPAELLQVKGSETSHVMWTKLHAIYESKGPARKASLLKTLILNKMQEQEETRAYLRRFFDVVDKLQEMELQINQELLAIILLYSLPDSFNNFRCAIES